MRNLISTLAVLTVLALLSAPARANDNCGFGVGNGQSGYSSFSTFRTGVGGSFTSFNVQPNFSVLEVPVFPVFARSAFFGGGFAAPSTSVVVQRAGLFGRRSNVIVNGGNGTTIIEQRGLFGRRTRVTNVP